MHKERTARSWVFFYSVSCVAISVITCILLIILDTLSSPIAVSEENLAFDTFSVNFTAFWIKDLKQIARDLTVFQDTNPRALVNVTSPSWSNWNQLYFYVCDESRGTFRRVWRPSSTSFHVNLIGAKQPHLCNPQSTEEMHFIAQRILQKASLTQETHGLEFHPFTSVLTRLLARPPSHTYIPYPTSNSNVNITSAVDALFNNKYFSATSVFRIDLKNGPLRNSHRASHGKPSVVGILVPSRQGDARDVVVFVFAMDWDDIRQYNITAVGTLFANYLSTVSWNSRDILVTFMDSKSLYGLGGREFLSDYLHNKTGAVPKRGIIRAAIVVKPDFTTPSLDLTVDTEGVDGRQPNLDLVALFILEATKQGLAVHSDATLWGSMHRRARNSAVHEIHSAFLQLSPQLSLIVLKFLLEFLRINDCFNREDIPAFTVGVHPLLLTSMPKLSRLTTSLLYTTRGISTLEESLHHSFNYYFLVGSHHFISSETFLILPVPMALLPYINILFLPLSDISSLLTSFYKFLMFSLSFAIVPWVLATKPIFQRIYNPECSPVSPDDYPIYAAKVIIWCAAACGGVLLKMLLCYISTRFTKSAKNAERDTQDSRNNQVVLCCLTTTLLLGCLMWNWSLGVFLTLWLVPGTLLFRPPNIIRQHGVHPFRATYLTLVAVQRFFFIAWIFLTFFFLAPFSGTPLIIHHRLLRSLRSIYRTKAFRSIPFRLRSVVPRFLSTFIPSGFFSHLRTHGFLDGFVKSTNLDHIFATWPSRPVYSATVLEKTLTLVPRRLSSFIHFLNPSLVISIYETMRDAHCIQSLYPALAWFVITPLVLYHILLFLLPSDYV